MGYKVYLGTQYQSQINVQEVLQVEYKNVHNGIIFYDDDRKCTSNPYDECMYEHLIEHMKSETEDSCTVPWIFKNDKVCTKPEDVNTTFWIAWKRITNQKKDCLTPCHTTLINVGAKNELKTKLKAKNEIGVIYAYFSAHVVQSKENYFITIIKLAGQIGGYIGLFRLSIFLLGLIKFDTLIDDTPISSSRLKRLFTKKAFFFAKKEEKEDDAEVKSNRDDPLIGLSILAIQNSPTM